MSITNIVVLMLENRSYDNMLGALYDTSNAPPYQKAPAGQAALDGFNGTVYTNPDPDDPHNKSKDIAIWGGASDATDIPGIDPGESFGDMSQQFLGWHDTPLLNEYPRTGEPLSGVDSKYGLMGGFAANYNDHKKTGALQDVMHYYVPALIPATAYLANRFMVCDKWFASAPTQTFANRMFAMCANPGQDSDGRSYIDDLDYPGVLDQPPPPMQLTTPSIFERLDGAAPASSGPNWKVYFHDMSMAALLLQYVSANLTSTTNVNLANFSDVDYPSGSKNPLTHPTTTFLEDIANETLPPFSIIEPRYSNNWPGIAAGLLPNSNHPGVSNYGKGTLKDPSASNPSIDVQNGERLLLEVYLALRMSSYWNNTIIIVTYDEPGGVFDHVPPPAAISPGASVPPSKSYGGFPWNWYGGRVPTIIVSQSVSPGTQLVAPAGQTFDHTSIIATAASLWGFDTFNDRDGSAPTIPLGPGSGNNPDPAEAQALLAC